MSLLSNKFVDLTIALFLVPGNYLVRTVADLSSGYFPASPDQPPFTDGGQLALWVSLIFWLTLIVETLFLYRYSLAIYNSVQDAYYQFRQLTERQLRRCRILRACQEAAGDPVITEETTIVQELGELNVLAAATLQYTNDHNSVGGTTVHTLSHSLNARKSDIRQALRQLEQLQFIGREPNAKPDKATYRLTPTGGLYLKACEIRRDRAGPK